MHLNDCPQQRYIPIFLLVSGISGLVMGMVCLPCTCRNEDRGWSPVSGLCATTSTLLIAFYFCWFITGVTVPSGVWCERTQAVKSFLHPHVTHLTFTKSTFNCLCSQVNLQYSHHQGTFISKKINQSKRKFEAFFLHGTLNIKYLYMYHGWNM